MKRLVPVLLALALFVVSNSCSKEPEEPKKGCKDMNSPDYDPEAAEGDTAEYCRYMYPIMVRITTFPANNNNNVPWDSLAGPDMYLVFKKDTSITWTYSTLQVNDAQGVTDLGITSSNIKFTNEVWRYELRDDDGGGTYEVMASGTFNPLQGHDSAIFLSLTGYGMAFIYRLE